MATDGELLKRYADSGDESAFGKLVERHGPMVRAVCKRLAGPDADDAAQAAFLLLERKARKLSGWRDVALWLHGTCRFVARTAKRERARRIAREKEAAAMQRSRSGSGYSQQDREDLREHLDTAVAALPERFREVVLLCHLEGASQEEAARRLGLPLGTVASRVSRGLERLRGRLSRRGLTLSAAALAGLLAEGASGAVQAFDAQVLLSSVMAASKLSAAGAAAGAAGVPAGILAKGAMQAMFWSKVKFAAAAVAAVTVMGSAVPVTVAAVQGAEGSKVEIEKPLAGEPAPPAPAPMPGGGAKVMIVGGSSSSGGSKASRKDVLRAAAAADLIAVVKVTKIEKAAADKAVPGRARVVFGGFGSEQKEVSAELLRKLSGKEAAKAVKFLVKTRGKGKGTQAVFEQKQDLSDPAVGVQRTFTRLKNVPFTLAVDKKSLVFLKLEKEIKDEAGKVTGRIYRLLPPLVDGAPEKTLALVREGLKNVAAWKSAPKLTAEQAKSIDALIAKLGDESYKTREKATKDLIAMGAIVRGKVREALKSSDAETKARAEEVLKAIKPDGLKPGKGSTTSTGEPGGVTIIRAGGAGGAVIKMEMKVGK